MSEVAVKNRTSTKNVIQNDEPKKFNVIFMNDNATPMDFVVQLLVEQFGHDHDRSYDIMMQVHEQGQAVAATYHLEMAEQKSLECIYLARQNGFPLDVKVKPA